MQFEQNLLSYTNYCALRKSVNWSIYSKEQAQKALSNSVYTVTVIEDDQVIGMGRLIGDGIYYVLTDIVVHPLHQQKGIGKKILGMLISYVDESVPIGGRASIQLISEKGKESFYKKAGFMPIPNDLCGSGMRKMICK